MVLWLMFVIFCLVTGGDVNMIVIIQLKTFD